MSSIFVSSVLSLAFYVMHFGVLHFHPVWFWWSVIFTSCIFSQRFCDSDVAERLTESLKSLNAARHARGNNIAIKLTVTEHAEPSYGDSVLQNTGCSQGLQFSFSKCNCILSNRCCRSPEQKKFERKVGDSWRTFLRPSTSTKLESYPRCRTERTSQLLAICQILRYVKFGTASGYNNLMTCPQRWPVGRWNNGSEKRGSGNRCTRVQDW